MSSGSRMYLFHHLDSPPASDESKIKSASWYSPICSQLLVSSYDDANFKMFVRVTVNGWPFAAAASGQRVWRMCNRAHVATLGSTSVYLGSDLPVLAERFIMFNLSAFSSPKSNEALAIQVSTYNLITGRLALIVPPSRPPRHRIGAYGHKSGCDPSGY